MPSPRLITTIQNTRFSNYQTHFIEIPPTRIYVGCYHGHEGRCYSALDARTTLPPGANHEHYSGARYESYEIEYFETWTPWVVAAYRTDNPGAMHVWFRPRPVRGPRSRLYRSYWPHVYQYDRPYGLNVSFVHGSYICGAYGERDTDITGPLPLGTDEDPLTRGLAILNRFISMPFRHHDWGVESSTVLAPSLLKEMLARNLDPRSPQGLFTIIAEKTKTQICSTSMMMPAELETLNEVITVASGIPLTIPRPPPRSVLVSS